MDTHDSTNGVQPWQPPTNSLQTFEQRESEARRRLRPATDEQIVKALASALTLSAPAGFSAGDRKAWLTAAAITLNGIPVDLLEWGVGHARKVADHPAKIIPAILAEVQERWDDRREALRRDSYDRRACLPPPSEPQEPPCTPEEAAQIMAEYGLTPETRATLRQHLGPPRKPTRADYIALGVDPAILDGPPA